MSAAACAPGWRGEWAAWRAILIHPVLQRRAQGTMWVNWMMVAMMLVFAALTAAKPNRFVFAIGVGLPLGMLCLMWWVLCFGSILDQLNPIAVRLTPHLRERARRVMVALWAAMVLAMTLVVGLPTGYPAHVGVATGLVLLELSVLFGWRRFFGLIAANWLLLNAGPTVVGWYAAFISSNASVAVGLVVLVFNGRIALRRMFSAPRRLSSSAAPRSIVPPAITRLTRILQAIAGDSTPRQPLITQVLGQSAFGGLRLMLVAAAFVATHGWLAWRAGGAPHEELAVTRFIMLMVLLMLQGAMAIAERTSGYGRRSEQSLVRLAPGAPSANELNRYLARYRLLGFGRMWLGATALAVAALLLLGATFGEAARAAMMCCSVLVYAGLPLHDYSRSEPMSGRLLIFLALYVTAAGGGAFFALRGAGEPATWLACALAAIVLAALFVRRRWANIAKAPPAFPAGRNR